MSWLVDLNYNFECDWLIELYDNKLSNNKLSDNDLARSFFKPITVEGIVIFMITGLLKHASTAGVQMCRLKY